MSVKKSVIDFFLENPEELENEASLKSPEEKPLKTEVGDKEKIPVQNISATWQKRKVNGIHLVWEKGEIHMLDPVNADILFQQPEVFIKGGWAKKKIKEKTKYTELEKPKDLDDMSRRELEKYSLVNWNYRPEKLVTDDELRLVLLELEGGVEY